MKQIWLDNEFVPKVTIENCSVVIYHSMYFSIQYMHMYLLMHVLWVLIGALVV